jgi:hypothetical protein
VVRFAITITITILDPRSAIAERSEDFSDESLTAELRAQSGSKPLLRFTHSADD